MWNLASEITFWQSENDDLALDAEFIDVYKGTHGVIMLLDITKPWFVAYVLSCLLFCLLSTAVLLA